MADPTKKKILMPKTCMHCGKEFTPKEGVATMMWAKRKFCSPECNKARNGTIQHLGRAHPRAIRRPSDG